MIELRKLELFTEDDSHFLPGFHIILYHSQAHKVVHASLSPPFGKHSTSLFLSSHGKYYCYIFPNIGTSGAVCVTLFCLV